MSLKPVLIVALVLSVVTRLLLLGAYPAGLNSDEAALGYNAWSLLQTGKDEHGASWPLVFRSFDDYKPGGYVYLLIPFVYFLGPTPLAVRLPSALLGIVSVYFLYKLVDRLFADQKQLKIGRFSVSLGQVSAFILATFPWHLHFSRGGWEVNASSSLWIIGMYLLVRFLQTKRDFLFAVAFLVYALYTYHSTRVVLPLTIMSLFYLYRLRIIDMLKLPKTKNTILLGFLLGGLLLLPLASQMLSKEGQSRFGGVSIFADSGPLWEALEYRNGHRDQIFNKVFHSKYVTYSRRVLGNYLLHYSPKFLFLNGDEIARSKTPGAGQALLFTAPLFVLGLWFLLKLGSPGSKFVTIWFLIAPVAAALTFQSPHALRAQNMVYPMAIIIAFGAYSLLKRLPVRSVIATMSLLALLLAYDFSHYLHQYLVHYPKELPYAWQYGFDQIADYVRQNQTKYNRIVISDRYDQPYILLAFFLKYPPTQLQKEIVMTPRDKFGFSTVRTFSKYYFEKIDYQKEAKQSGTLLIAADEPLPSDSVIHEIKDPSGKTMYRFAAIP